MTELHIEKPNEKQRLFLEDDHKYLAYGGARGGGKSWAVRVKSTLLAAKYPGIKLLILRRTYPELLKNHINNMRAMLHGLARYNKTEKVFRFVNGSTIQFGYCDTDSDVDQFQGQEYDVIFIDEAGQFRQEWIEKINACVRGVNGFPKQMCYTLNPGGVGHAYFKRLFVDRQFKEKEHPEDYAFIQATVYDNHALTQADPEYVERLEILPYHQRKAWLEGDWDIYEGQVFSEFKDDPAHYKDRRFTHVIDPFDVPADWPVYRSYDFGYAKPFSVGWWTVDYDGVLYRIAEMYGCVQDSPNEGLLWTPDRQFDEINRVERTHPWMAGKTIRGVADPAIWDSSNGVSVYDTALKHHVYFEKGDNRRIPGWMQMHYRMSFDAQGYARLYVFRGCRDFIRTIPTLAYDRHNVEDVDSTLEDHIADETRYFCMSRPIKPQRTVERPRILSDPLEQYGGAIGSFEDARRILT